MILGQIAWVDCIVFLVFLAPQLLIQVGVFGSLNVAIRALPFLGQSQKSVLDIWDCANNDAQ